MAAHVQSFPVPSAVERRAPSATWTLLVSLFASVKQRLAEPRMPRMSEEWLQNYERSSRQSHE
jgi:plasmid stabilization system protein ParE